MGKLFKAQTAEGYTIKVLADLLQNNIKTACLLVNDNGFKLCMYDSHRRVCFSFNLDAENFQIYKFKPVNSLYLGLNLSHFYKMIKSIKKKDAIILFIDEKSPSDLNQLALKMNRVYCCPKMRINILAINRGSKTSELIVLKILLTLIIQNTPKPVPPVTQIPSN